MIIRNIVFAVIGLVPDFGFAENTAVFAEAVSWFCWGNYYLPLNTFIASLAGIFGAWLACSIVRVLVDLL